MIPQHIREELRETMLAYARQKGLIPSELLTRSSHPEEQSDLLMLCKNDASAQAPTVAKNSHP